MSVLLYFIIDFVPGENKNVHTPKSEGSKVCAKPACLFQKINKKIKIFICGFFFEVNIFHPPPRNTNFLLGVESSQNDLLFLTARNKVKTTTNN